MKCIRSMFSIITIEYAIVISGIFRNLFCHDWMDGIIAAMIGRFPVVDWRFRLCGRSKPAMNGQS